jgi:hypothetical protein
MQNDDSKEIIESIKDLNISTKEPFQQKDENCDSAKPYIYLTFFNSKAYRYFILVLY